MSVRSPRNLLSLLLVANMAATPLAVSLSDEAAWYFEDVKQRGTIAALCWICCSLITYRQLAFKSIAALTACYFSADVLTWPLWMWLPHTYDTTPYLTALITGALAVWYYCRSYYWPSDRIEPGVVYLVRKRPDSPQDLAMAMLGRRPLGGISVMINGDVWGFRHGVLERRCYVPCRSKYVIMGVRPADKATIDKLSALEGSRWTLTHNCVTALLPVAVRTP